MASIIYEGLHTTNAGPPGLRDSARAAVVNDCYAPPPLPELPETPFNPGALRPHPALRVLDVEVPFAAAFVPSHSRVAVIDRETRALLEGLPAGNWADPRAYDALQTLHALGLLTETGRPVPRPSGEPRTLLAWLHLTNACNLRCDYCYIAKSHEAMQLDVGHAAIDTVLRSAEQHGYRDVLLKYAGGEPLLALDTAARLHAYGQERATQTGICIRGAFLSNGTALTRAKIAAIRAIGASLTISLDGLAVTHDSQRPTISGRGSATVALRGIERALAHDLVPDIAITVTPHSAVGLPALVEWLLARGLRFALSFARDHQCSGTSNSARDEQTLIEGMRAAYAVIARNPPPWSVLSGLLDRTDLSAPRAHACAAGRDYLVIDHHGRIAGCQTQLQHVSASVASPDPLGAIRADPRAVRQIDVDQKEGCRTCEWRYWCAGGCPIATYRATGRYDIQSPNCAIYKALYPDIVRLEAQRLLHWHRLSHICP